jgi:hypothetical protein
LPPEFLSGAANLEKRRQKRPYLCLPAINTINFLITK